MLEVIELLLYIILIIILVKFIKNRIENDIVKKRTSDANTPHKR